MTTHREHRQQGMNMIRLKLFTEWQEYRGGRTLRQILLQPSYFKRKNFSIHFHQISHGHIVLLLLIDEVRVLVVLDRLIHDGSSSMDITIDYMESSSYTLQQWLDSSGCFQMEIDENPVFVQVLKVNDADYLWVITEKGIFLCWKYDLETAEWTFTLKYNLFQYSKSKLKIIQCFYYENNSTLIWIEDGDFESEIFEFIVANPKYRVRYCDIRMETLVVNFSPPITLFTSETFYSAYLSELLLYYFTQKDENKIIYYSFLTGNLQVLDLNLVPASPSVHIKNFYTTSFEIIPALHIQSEMTMNIFKGSSKPQLSRTSSSSLQPKEVLPVDRLYLLHRENEMIYLFEQNHDYFSKLMLRQVIDISYSSMSSSVLSMRNKKSSVGNGLLSPSPSKRLSKKQEQQLQSQQQSTNRFEFMILTNSLNISNRTSPNHSALHATQISYSHENEEFIYLGHVSAQKKDFEVFKIPILFPPLIGNIILKNQDDQIWNRVSSYSLQQNSSIYNRTNIEMPFQYLHGKEIESFFLINSFFPSLKIRQHPRMNAMFDIHLQRTNKDIHNIAAITSTIPTKYMNIPMIWNRAGIFQLEIPLLDEKEKGGSNPFQYSSMKDRFSKVIFLCHSFDSLELHFFR
jgi:hypothetical protein